jgi:hypothetical protein
MASSTPDLGPDELVYVEKVRRAAKRFAEQAADDVQTALQAVRGTAHFDVEAPTSSARREVELMKTGVKRVSAWYMRYLSAQLDTFAANLVRLADALVAQSQSLESGNDELIVRIGAVEERLRRLEAAAGSPATLAKSASPARRAATKAATKPAAPTAKATARAAEPAQPPAAPGTAPARRSPTQKP